MEQLIVVNVCIICIGRVSKGNAARGSRKSRDRIPSARS
jgi:hypothetical protein